MHIYHICVQILRGTGHLVAKEKTGRYIWSHRLLLQEENHRGGGGSRSIPWVRDWDVKGLNSPAGKKKHLLITVSTPESIMVFIVAVFIWGPTVWVLEWSKLTNPPRSNWVYKAAVYSCGIKPLDCKKALLMAGSWAPTKAPFVKIPAKQRWCIVSGPPNNRADDYFLTTLLAALTRWLITLWYGK